MTKEKLKAFFRRLYARFFEEDLLSNSAQVAFYFTFALFPLLLFLVSLSGLVLESANELRGELFYYLSQIMPSSAYNLVQDTIKEVTEESSGGKLTIGLLVALWSASAGVDSLRGALNSVYNYKERRTIWKTRGISLLVTLALVIIITIAAAALIYGWQLFLHLLQWFSLPAPAPFVLIIVQWVVVLALLVFIFALLYNFLPNNEFYEWEWVTPGAVTGIVLWILLSYAFRLYLSYFNSYSATYGSLGAVIILLLWLYLTALVILIGGLINSILENMTDEEGKPLKEKKVDPEKAEEAKEETSADSNAEIYKTEESEDEKSDAHGKAVEKKE